MTGIKFRAWDNEERKYHRGCCNLILDLNGMPYWQFGFDAPSPMPRERFELERFAGFVDRNDTEVFEGDIVKAVSQGHWAKFVIKWRQSCSPCWLLWPGFQNREFWYIHCSNLKPIFEGPRVCAPSDTYQDDGLEVIGNIRENPEFLEEIKARVGSDLDRLREQI